ncbi:ubiquitin 3 binding protein But2 C-terminal domain-containing protein [Myxozyma melibiosi]|uniref:Ubiquitin 3 binding protein But2 C-terminal domain-containing protein n=1 Tax=Myxozyma melibiosi TaxID=54550 RepID=A0ABR1F6A8_9ASCO
MKFNTASSFALASLAASLVSAAPLSKRADSTFSLLTIASGSALQYANVGASDGAVTIAGDSTIFTIDSGRLFIDGSEQIIYIDPSSRQVKYSTSPPAEAVTVAWSLSSDGNSLVLNSESNGVACPASGSAYSLYWGNGTSADFCGSDAIGVELYYVEETVSASSSSVASSTSSVAAATSSVAAATSSAAASSSEDLFGVLAIRSGSPIQYAGLSIKGDGNLYFGAETSIENYIDSGALKIEGSDATIYVDPKTSALKYSTNPPAEAVAVAWTIDGTTLELNGESDAIACGDNYQVYWSTSGSDDVCGGKTAYGALLYVSPISSTTAASTTSSAAVSTVSAAGSSSATTTTTLVTKTKTAAGSAATTTTVATTSVAVAAAASAAKATASLLPPNLLIPVKKENPNKVFGAQYTGSIVAGDKEVDTFASFDIPQLKDSVKSCKLIWTPPSANSFPSTISGSKKFQIFKIADTLDESTLSWNKRPTRGDLVGVVDATTGTFTASSVSCDFGKKQQFELAPYGSEDEVSWFQEWNPLTGLNYALLA